MQYEDRDVLFVKESGTLLTNNTLFTFIVVGAADVHSFKKLEDLIKANINWQDPARALLQKPFNQACGLVAPRVRASGADYAKYDNNKVINIDNGLSSCPPALQSFFHCLYASLCLAASLPVCLCLSCCLSLMLIVLYHVALPLFDAHRAVSCSAGGWSVCRPFC